MPSPTKVSDEAHALAAALAEAKPMRRGSVSERYMKCSKPGCRCAEHSEARHGPYYSWTRSVKGRTQSRYLSAEQAQLVHRQIQAGQRFRQQLEAYWQAAESWADAQLEASVATSEGAEKGGSRERSARRLPES
ncbi:MAG: hypothetical protein O2816_18900 [Planctomycetota bacterium]|nr:hypothetical protein [Planctomycetota bacterium]